MKALSKFLSLAIIALSCFAFTYGGGKNPPSYAASLPALTPVTTFGSVTKATGAVTQSFTAETDGGTGTGPSDFQVSGPMPYPTPAVNLESYLPKVDPNAPVIEIKGSSGEVGPYLQAASDELDKRGRGKGIIRFSGKGVVSKRPILNHHLYGTSRSELVCNQQDAWLGCIILKDGVLVDGVTVHEPTYDQTEGGWQPAITIFQTYADFTSNAHEKLARNISIINSTFIGGKRTRGDGGTRSTLAFTNCDTCAAANNNFINTSSIGVQWGGASTSGHFARHCLSYYNRFEGVVAAHEAIVNGEDILVIGSSSTRPSRVGFSGGVSLIDMELNAETDHGRRIGIYNVSCDYTEAGLVGGAGNCINIQNSPNSPFVRDVTVANFTAHGGDPADSRSKPLSNGIFVNGEIPGLLVTNGTVTKAGQTCVQAHGGGKEQIYRNIDCVSCGGGGIFAIELNDVNGALFQNNRIFDAKVNNVSTDPRIRQTCAVNRFERNMNGPKPVPVVSVCPRPARTSPTIRG
ncbi:MAG TPA: hypothetical protein VEW46_09045 [Pyrinomonadaceae bacterium]|nr:hypothetical protein [Pyrinomonadaceae bacterium]